MTDILRKLSRRVRNSIFAKNILKVTFGTGLAQLISLCAIPLLSRVYSVEEFGVLGIYIGFAVIARVVFSCRYDFAIPAAKRDGEAYILLWLGVILSVFFACVSYVVIHFTPSYFLEKFNELIYLFPIMFFITSIDNILSLWVNRIKRFGMFSVSRIIRAFSIVVSQFLVGTLSTVDNGLIYGFLIGESITVLFVISSLFFSMKVAPKLSIRRIIFVAKKHRKNPIYLLPGHALNTSVAQLPIIIIESVYGATFAGIFYMAQRIVLLPSQLISAAIFKVFFPEAARRYNKTGSCYQLAKKTVLGTFLICLLLFLMIDIITYNFIGEILGEQWQEARLTILILSAIELLPAIFYPISGVWFITNNQKSNLKYQLIRTGFVCIGLFIGVNLGGYYVTLICYGFFRSLSFLLFLIKCFSLSKGDLSPQLTE